VSPARGSYKRFHVDATKVASRGVNASNTGPHLHPCKKSKGLGKHGRLEDNQGTTESRRMQTPINLFEDECVFCHSFRTSEVICCISFPYVKLKSIF
jgi:BRCA1-associated RING domain protein 1